MSFFFKSTRHADSGDEAQKQLERPKLILAVDQAEAKPKQLNTSS